MRRAPSLLLLLATLLAGCNKGEGTVRITVDAQPPLSSLARLHGTATVGTTTRSFDVELTSPTIPPVVTFAIVVPRKLGPQLALTLEARDSADQKVAQAGGMAEVRGGEKTELAITFSGTTPPPPPDDKPRPIAPQNSARVTSGRPSLRFVLPAGASNPQVELSTKRDFSAAIVAATVDASGGVAHLATDLAKGVWYWRVRASGAGGTVTSPVWQFWVTVRGTGTDGAWGHVLDVDGNGYADVAISGSGNVYVYRGSADGVQTQPTVLFSPDGAAAPLGIYGLAVAGDVDGDGFGDLVAATLPPGTGGNVYVFRGSADGVATAPSYTLGPFPGEQIDRLSGGDFDRDGYSDVAVTLLRQHADDAGGIVNDYRVLVYRGAAGGPDKTPHATLTDLGIGNAATTGDINGDGYSDLLSGRTASNQAVFYVGGEGGLAQATPHAIANPEPTANIYFGNAVALGDFRGQGSCSALISAYGYNDFVGRVYFYQLSPDVTATPVMYIDGVDGNIGEFGESLAVPGDVDGDGLIDFVVGGSGAIARARLFLGNSNLPSTTPKATLQTALGNRDGGMTVTRFGQTMGGIGDLDGDGFDDFGVGATGVNDESGAVIIYYGTAGAFPGRTFDLLGSNVNGGFGSALTDARRWRCRWRHC